MLDAIKNQYGLVLFAAVVLFAMIYFLAWLGGRATHSPKLIRPINSDGQVKAIEPLRNVIINVRYPINY